MFRGFDFPVMVEMVGSEVPVGKCEGVREECLVCLWENEK